MLEKEVVHFVKMFLMHHVKVSQAHLIAEWKDTLHTMYYTLSHNTFLLLLLFCYKCFF